MTQPIQIDGTKPLWGYSIRPYIEFIQAHFDEFWEHVEAQDENALFIRDMIANGDFDNETHATTLAVIVERYISDYHPDIAVIIGGYPKSEVAR